MPPPMMMTFLAAGCGNGGAVASPAFSEMMSYTLRHFKVAPTGTKVQPFQVYG